jgi:transposase-like protein
VGIQIHLAGLSLSNISLPTSLGVERCCSAVHNWVQKADFQPTESHNPDYVAVDKTVIRVNSQRYWLFITVDSDLNHLLHVRLFPTRTSALTELFHPELREEHLVDDATFPVNGAPYLQAACHRHSLRTRHQRESECRRTRV